MTDDLTAEEIVRLNSHELTALQLVTERRGRREDAERSAQAYRDTLATLDRAQEIGLRVLAAQRQGRKTVRVADLLDAGEPS